MALNRIYQGRVSKVETLNDSGDWTQLPAWQDALWRHHVLFQDAVNYYITAIASLGSSPESTLTGLRNRLAEVWECADKKGQSREGMCETFKRVWQTGKPPTLEETIARFRQPLLDNGVSLETMQAAGENMMKEMGGEGAISQGSKTFWYLFCDPDSGANSPDDDTALNREIEGNRLRRLLHDDATTWDSPELDAFGVLSIATPNNKAPLSQGAKARATLLESIQDLSGKSTKKKEKDDRLKKLIADFRDAHPDADEQFDRLTTLLAEKQDDELEMTGYNGSSAKGQVGLFLRAFLVFHYIEKSPFTFALLKHFRLAPPQGQQAEEQAPPSNAGAIRKCRGSHGYIFKAFTSLNLWNGVDGLRPCWNKFDIIAFAEALKVWNQYKQNKEKRENKLNGFASKLLVMDGENAIAGYDGDGIPDKPIRERLQKIWTETNGKPKISSDESGEDVKVASFSGDPRIDRLRRIVNDDLAEEYRLTDGSKTPYGLRGRTMKGWDAVKREWRKIDKLGTTFSEEKKTELQKKLDDLRGGDKCETIGSHKLFSALISDGDAWAVWQEPDEKLQKTIEKKGWAQDPLNAFREYCELREKMEEISLRPLRFTPADPKYSRRLFMFKEACSFGSDTGDYKHDANALAVTVPVALSDASGRFLSCRCRLVYSAPRLLRDNIRAEDGRYEQDWCQPMIKALFGDGSGKVAPQQLKDAAVILMPDFDVKGNRRFLLNFPFLLDEGKIKERIGKTDIWNNQFKFSNDQLRYLLWPSDPEVTKKEIPRWWQQIKSFCVLSADLGTRHAASISLIEATSADAPPHPLARRIGTANGKDWFARSRLYKILRLQGENTKVVRMPSQNEKETRGEYGKAFREEFHGEYGRLATSEEYAETRGMLVELGQEKMIDDLDELSFPEMNDKLMVAIRRAQNWISNCVSWLWKLEKPDNENQRQVAVQQLREQDRKPEWAERAKNNDVDGLKSCLRREISEQRERVQKLLLTLTGRILPMRGRKWEWVEHPDTEKYAGCHLLRQTQDGTASYKVWLRGQRGLSMARIEQLSELRRRWQSLNQALRVAPGDKPPTASEMRAATIPDPCPDILNKLENIREQRVNQTAHLILAEALGLGLRVPEMDKRQRRATDTHGEYKVIRPPADFIVLEDLSRYLSAQGRAKSENSRLMKWCHRAVANKLKEMAQPFGIAVLETQAAYTSRFCSLTGVAGFRAVEVGSKNHAKFRWRSLLKPAENKNSDAWKLLSDDRKKEATHVETLFKRLKELEQAGHKNPTLLAPQPGGPIFVSAIFVNHSDGKEVIPMQADLNASINIALRAIAAPDCTDIHHRVQTKRTAKDVKTHKARRFGKNQSTVIIESGSMPKETYSNLFYDEAKIVKKGRAKLADEKQKDGPYAIAPILWDIVNNRENQWQRVNEINKARLEKWNEKRRVKEINKARLEKREDNLKY